MTKAWNCRSNPSVTTSTATKSKLQKYFVLERGWKQVGQCQADCFQSDKLKFWSDETRMQQISQSSAFLSLRFKFKFWKQKRGTEFFNQLAFEKAYERVCMRERERERERERRREGERAGVFSELQLNCPVRKVWKKPNFKTESTLRPIYTSPIWDTRTPLCSSVGSHQASYRQLAKR